MKQIILIRKDLGMGKGKMCAQACHASLNAAEIAQKDYPHYYKKWKKEGEEKVVVKVDNEKELLQLFQNAKKTNLPCYLVKDAGRTQLPPGVKTAVGIGPGPEKEIDKITKELPLL